MFDLQSQAGAIRWLTWKNDSTGSASPGEAPAFAILRPILAANILQFETTLGQTAVYCGKPEVDNSGRGYMVNGPFAVKLGSFGKCTLDWPAYAAYDTADGVPEYGEIWGAKDNDWKLRKGYQGFEIIGGHTNGRVLVRPEVAGTSSTAASVASGASMAKTGTQNVSSGAAVQVTLTEKLVYGDCTTASNEITLSPAGQYQFHASLSASHGSTGIGLRIRIYKNGALLDSEFDSYFTSAIVSGSLNCATSGVATFADGDTLELWVLSASALTWTIQSAQLVAQLVAQE